jgi:hypothetical protein
MKEKINNYDNNLETAVLFLVFNRLHITKRVFERIKQVKPLRLYLASDGPRPEKEGEDLVVNSIRNYLLEQIDWDCEIKTLFRDKNLGCKYAVSGAIDWFFQNEEYGIILEDDCLPSLSFFTYCELLLRKFQNDNRIMLISGTNILATWKSKDLDYFFSYYGGIWGWASWRRAWLHYDVDMKHWGNKKGPIAVKNVLIDLQQSRERCKIFDEVFKHKIDTWDYQWSFARLMNSGLSVVPTLNLISNLGFNNEATHTIGEDSELANLPIYELKFPLKENLYLVPDRDYDRSFFKKTQSNPILNLIKKVIKYINKFNIFI